ncbi:MAG TPA: hypothetical protein VHM70_29730 [Polyangiaceae bacterium]|nr:hypothetical protein [Polyangiaceae bacterium]
MLQTTLLAEQTELRVHALGDFRALQVHLVTHDEYAFYDSETGEFSGWYDSFKVASGDASPTTSQASRLLAVQTTIFRAFALFSESAHAVKELAAATRPSSPLAPNCAEQ